MKTILLTEKDGTSKQQDVATAPQSPCRLTFWGVRGSIPAPGPETVVYGGNTACVEVRADGELIILDAGTGIRGLGLALNAEFKDKPISLSLLITHTHWDHIQGFPFFLPAYDAKNNITIFGVEGARQGLQSTLSIQMDSPYFPVSLEQMPGHIRIQEIKEPNFKIGNLPVRTQLLNHPGLCTGYRIFTPTGSVCYVPDVELGGRKNHAPTDQFPSQTIQEDKLLDFVSGAEVLILDSQYDETEYNAHAGWGHSSVENAVLLAIRANVQRLFLFHHDPDHNDEQVSHLVTRARQIAAQHQASLLIEAAREGLEVEI